MRRMGITSGVLAVAAPLALIAAAVVFAQTTSGITNLRTENLYANGVDIRWETATSTDSTVYYGFAPGNYPYTSSPSQRCDGGALVTSHCVRLSGLTEGTTYYYRARSVNNMVDYQLDGAPFLAANTNTSGAGGTVADSSPPSAPTSLSATALSSSQIVISWQAATDDVGVAAYKVFRDGTFIASVGATNYTDGNLSPATTYSYRVKAADASGKESDFSAPTSAQTAPASGSGAAPAAPGGFTALPGSASYGPIVGFTWHDVAYEDSYKIYQRAAGVAGGAWTLVLTAAANASAASIPAPSSGLYDYHVKACNGIGCSPESNIASVAVDLCTSSSCDTSAPSAPTSLRATALSTSRIDIAWSASSDNVGVSGYKVYRNGAYAATVQTTAYSDPYVAPGVTYHYSVIAFDGAGHPSEPSLTLSVTAPYYDATNSTTTGTITTTTVATPPPPAPTTTTDTTTTTTTMTSSAGTLSPPTPTMVSKSVGVFVEPGDVRCDLNTPRTAVVFGAIPEGGATFRVTNKTAATVREIGAGGHLLPNGSYVWEAFPYPGYTIGGTKSGALVLDARCATAATSAPPPTTASPTTVKAPLQSAPTMATSSSERLIVRLNEPLPAAQEATTSVPVEPPPALSASRPAAEYAAYCDDPAHRAECERFVAAKMDPFAPVSVASGVPPGELLAVIPAITDLPVPVETPEQFSALCAQRSYARRCADLLEEAQVFSEEEARRRAEEVVRERAKVDEILNGRVGARAVIDTDNDGISDYDEVNIYRTDPKNADTNGDGVLDGDHLLLGTDPLYELPAETATTSTVGGLLPILTGTSTAIPVSLPRERPIAREHPQFAGEKKPELLAIERVEAAPLNNPGAGKTTTVRLAGKALPNSFVTVYVFSEPIVVVVKADETGAWEYTLDRELPDGTHEAWSAIVDASGRILAKSDPLPFVKVAEAVTVGSPALAAEPAEPGFFSGTSLYLFFGVLALVAALAFFLIGWIVRRSAQPSFPEGM